MGKHSIIIEHCFEGDETQIYNSFHDFREYGKHHPYITEVKIINDSSDQIEFEVWEELKLLGFIRSRPYYRVTVQEMVKGKHLQYRSLIKDQVNLTIDVHFTNTGSITQVKEIVMIDSSPIIASFFIPILRKAHLEFSVQLKEYLNSNALSFLKAK